MSKMREFRDINGDHLETSCPAMRDDIEWMNIYSVPFFMFFYVFPRLSATDLAVPLFLATKRCITYLYMELINSQSYEDV